MGYGIAVELYGEYALFSRPEFKVERYSYDVITPSAARGALEAIYWKPAIRYVIDRIHVYNEPRFTNIRRNEVSVKVLSSDIKRLMEGSKGTRYYINTRDVIQQRGSMVLTDVRYIIEAHFEMTDRAGIEDTPEKHYNILLRRLRKGQMYHQPYFGCREFPANFRLVEGEVPKSGIVGEKDLGFMLYDLDFTDAVNITPMFFKAKWIDGIIDLTNIEIVR